MKVEKRKSNEMVFPKDFLWGTSSSSHQVEGQNIMNDWWAWEQRGKVLNRQESGDACNQYNLYKRDFDMMERMNHNAHRLSIEWSRIEPKEGQFDQKEIEHYKKVLRYLRSKGIRPVVTLYHFTLPYWFAKKGGFVQKDAREIFDKYIEKIVSELGGMVDIWVTINEPFVYANFGYWEGKWPPGIKSVTKFLKVIKTLLYAHIDSYQTIQKVYKKKKWPRPQIGFSKNFIWFEPFKKISLFSRILAEIYHYFYNKLYFKPFYTGRLPLILGFGKMKKAKECIDFIGMNYYFRCTCKFNPFKSPLHVDMKAPPGREKTLFDWEVYPEGLYKILKINYKKFKKPILITENGISTLDDDQRTSFIIRHLHSIHRAIEEGIDVRGYLYWSLIDNFEWAEGYTQPFGLVEMNQKTFDRIPKSSAQVYSEICKNGKITDKMMRKYAKSICK